MTSYGNLYIIATPIGNLEDITLRALSTLKQVHTIVCEDTRVSRKLLSHYKISKPLISYNNFNEKNKTSSIISLLKEGKHIALISDAGTPLISDPGFSIVRECQQYGIGITAIPGACSLITALTICGLPLNKFTYLGFLEKSSTKKQKLLESHKGLNTTLCFFESPRRLLTSLQDIQMVFGNTQEVVVARELTKMFEEVKRDTVENIIKYYQTHKPLGEIVVMLHPSGENSISMDTLSEVIKKKIHTEQPSYLAKRLAKEFNLNKNDIYDEIVKIKNSL